MYYKKVLNQKFNSSKMINLQEFFISLNNCFLIPQKGHFICVILECIIFNHFRVTVDLLTMIHHQLLNIKIDHADD